MSKGQIIDEIKFVSAINCEERELIDFEKECILLYQNALVAVDKYTVNYEHNTKGKIDFNVNDEMVIPKTSISYIKKWTYSNDGTPRISIEIHSGEDKSYAFDADKEGERDRIYERLLEWLLNE